MADEADMMGETTTQEVAAPPPTIPNVPLLRRLQSGLNSYTSSDRAVAAHILDHYGSLSYETAASLAARVGVSEITIGRFARKLGFRNFKALKHELQDNSVQAMPWLIGEDLAKFVEASDTPSERDLICRREMNALLAVYRLAETPLWTTVIELLARSRTVHVAGFQTERGVAMLLAHQLQFMRDGVRLVDLGAGNYADIFASNDKDACLVVIDIRRYSRQSYLVAEQAHQQGIPLVILTDQFCDWAARFTPHVLAVPTQIGTFWSSWAGLVGAVNLIVNDIVRLIGPDVEQRLERLTKLHQSFTGYVGHQPARAKAMQTET